MSFAYYLPLVALVSRRIYRIGQNHINLNNTLFTLLSNFARHPVLALIRCSGQQRGLIAAIEARP